MVNSGLEIIFNGIFEAHISRRKRAESRFLPRKSTTAVSIYLPPINQGAVPWKPARCLRRLHRSSELLPALGGYLRALRPFGGILDSKTCFPELGRLM
jgi:hypothetical protein